MGYKDRQQVGHPFLNLKKDRKDNVIIGIPALADNEYFFPFDNPVRKDVFLGCFIAPYFHLVEAGIADRFNVGCDKKKSPKETLSLSDTVRIDEKQLYKAR